MEATEKVSGIRRAKQFLVDAWAELQKTTWPTRKEVEGTTIVVIIAVLICAAYLYVVDIALQGGMDRLIRTFGR